MVEITQLKTVYDELEETNGDDECRAWLNKVFDAKIELAKFTAARRGGGRCTEYVGFLKGSFNLSFHYKFDDDGPDAIIRFPKPGHTATNLRDEKVANEVQVMEYISKNTTIPIPRVLSWGLTTESPQELGPFIIMDYVEGTLLTNIIKQPNEDTEASLILDPDVDDLILNKVYRQIAGYLLQLSQLKFDKIGAISRDENSDKWSVTKRPLTYDMNELATVAGCSQDFFPTSTLLSTSDYLAHLSRSHKIHLQTQRNLSKSPDVAKARFQARHQFAKLIPKYTVHDVGPFILFCDDLRPANMLVNPETMQITAVLDLEFTNAMPAQFTYDPPWWLLLSGPEWWLEESSIDEFRKLYEPRLEQFLSALEDAESEEKTPSAETPLSVRMRESWKCGRLWFDYAARRSYDVDVIYWGALAGAGTSTNIDEHDELRLEMDRFVEEKMEQLEAYNDECTARFSAKEDDEE